MKPKPRKQCKSCPWIVGNDPFEIPNGYCPDKHAALADTIAEPGGLSCGPMRIMACHYSNPGAEVPCVGWLANQLGEGNNIALRLAAINGRIDANVRTIGEQHAHFEDTLP